MHHYHDLRNEIGVFMLLAHILHQLYLFLISPFSSVIVFIVSHLGHLAPKSDIFQKA